MTSTARLAALGGLAPGIPDEALRRAAVRATLAPSVHNTQPWRIVLGTGTLAIHADFSRQLRLLDPTRRQLLISCGCALLNARVSLAADGYLAEVRRYPDGGAPELLAQLSGGPGSDPALAALDPLLGLRRTNRRHFAEDPVPTELVDALIQAARQEGADLFPISRQAHRVATAVLSQRADAIQNADSGYRAELRAWVTDDPRRTDGVPTATLPLGSGSAVDEVPVRDFGDPGSAGLGEAVRSGMDQCLLLLVSDGDDPLSWLRSGEALERLWLEVTRAGYAISLLTQVVEVPSTRELLRSELGLTKYPHVLLRVGRAPATPATRRRKLVEVLRQERGSGPALR
jgi:nitroreductase